MSPNEFQLRSALRAGEGERVDPDTVIARARGLQQARHDRRVRYGSVAAVVAVVGGIGVVGGITLQGSGSHTDAGSAGGQAQPNADRNPAAAAPAGTTPFLAPGPLARAAAIPCPATPPRLALPGGGGTGQFGAHDPLFNGPVEAAKVCGYPNGESQTPGGVPSTVVTGPNATNLVTSLNAASATPPASIKCPAGPASTTLTQRSMVIIALSTGGTAMRAVVVSLSCPTRATNGTAVRYGWTPPLNLIRLIGPQGQRVSGSGPVVVTPTGKVTGSPIRS